MDFLESAGSFMEGLKSVLDIPGEIRRTIADGVSAGIEAGMERGRKRMMASGARFAFLAIGVFFLAWGIAKVLDSYSQLPGLGYVVIGFVAVLVWLLLGALQGNGD